MNGTRKHYALAAIKRRNLALGRDLESELRALAQSWLDNPIHDIFVRKSDMTCVDGNRRLAGLDLLGVTEAEVFIVDGDLSDADLDRIALETAYHRAPMGGFEQADTLRRIKEATGLNNKELAAKLRIDASMVTKLLSIIDCEPAVQDAARSGLIGVTDWYAISRSEVQLVTLNLKLGGATRDQLEESNRAARDAQKGGEESSKKAASIKVIVDGVTVTLKKEGDLSLDDAIRKLPEALRELERAKKAGHDAKTLAALMKKKAKAVQA